MNEYCVGCNKVPLNGNERCMAGVPKMCTGCDIGLCLEMDEIHYRKDEVLREIRNNSVILRSSKYGFVKPIQEPAKTVWIFDLDRKASKIFEGLFSFLESLLRINRGE